jgi:hypothetical protein
LTTSVQRCAIHDPTIWSYVTAPATRFCGIDIVDNSYWCHIYNPSIRIDSGELDTIPHGIRFSDNSNAGRVIGGNINNCDNGVTLQGSNSVTIAFTAFETVDDGIEFVENVNNDNASSMVIGCRFEAYTHAVNISQTTSPGGSNRYRRARFIDNINIDASEPLVYNPNGHKVGMNVDAHIWMVETTSALNFMNSRGDPIMVRAGQGSPENNVAARVGSLYLREDGGAGTTLYVKQSGSGTTGWVGK